MYIKRRDVIIIVAIVLVVLLGVGYFVFQRMMAAQNAARSSGGTSLSLTLDENAQIVGAPEDAPKPPDIKIPGYARMEVPAGETDVAVMLVNPEGNPCYFTFEIVLSDTNESLYQSALVEPSKSIQQATLSRGLEAGEYNATIKIRTFALEGMGEMNGADMNTLLVAK